MQTLFFLEKRQQFLMCHRMIASFYFLIKNVYFLTSYYFLFHSDFFLVKFHLLSTVSSLVSV